jgi:general secretion pathway protein M
VIAALRQWWTGLSQRERMATSIGGGLALVLVIYLVALEPAWRARSRLSAELPRLRAEAAEMDALAQEAKRLRTRTIAVESPEQLKAALNRLLAEKQITGITIRDGEDRRVLLSARRVEAAAWLAWMKDVSSELPLRVASARISRAAPGVVDAELTLSPPGQK